MKNVKTTYTVLLGIFLVLAAIAPGVQTAHAAVMNDYCATPPFIGTSVTPNMLMIIDNSASMFDLSYVDRGAFTGTCSVTTAKTCSATVDCPVGEACTGTTFTRTPYYCYDQTFSSTKAGGYTGYFDQAKFYEYDLTNYYFFAVDPFPDVSVCTDDHKIIPNTLLICHTTSNLTKFVAKGNYLNWLTASKFDIQKQILTGGKYLDKICSGSSETNTISCGTDADCPAAQTCIDLVPNVMQAESRGCVGWGFVKEALKADYAEAVVNTSLGITFSIKGPTDTTNQTAPSPGGQTYINVFLGDYNQARCQAAIDAITNSSSSNAEIKKAVDDCLTSTTAAGAWCKLDPLHAVIKPPCTKDSDCNMGGGWPCSTSEAGICKKGACTNAGKFGIACTTNTSCNVSTCSGGLRNGQSCTVSTDCADDYGPCISGTATTESKTKVVFNQSMQACWAYRKGTDIGTDEVTTVHNQCEDLYDENYICLGGDNDGKICASIADCPGVAAACVNGPAAIRPGNPSYICSTNYVGFCATSADLYTTTTWTARGFASADECIKQKHREYCNAMEASPVIDPTDAPSETTNYDNLPAIISDIGVEAQLGQPLKRLRVRVSKASPPTTSLLQDFSNRIRMGAMAFNSFGSAAECLTDTTMCAKTCSTDPTRRCSTQFDCPSPGSAVCSNSYATDRDGSKILYYIGWGYCYTNLGVKTATRCTTDANCGATETCRSDGVGDHSSGLIMAIDNIRASTWTPFAEALYNATGYFAKTSTGQSRTDLRINATDFNENYNPSQKHCQDNNIVLITDGMSTADRNVNVNNLAVTYAAAGGQTGWSPTCPKYDGSVNVDNIAWIAQHRRISDFSLSSASTTTPSKNNEKINTFVVFTGASSNEPGECNSETLLSQTAINGGTSMYSAEHPDQLSASLKKLFETISKKAASGSAVSVLTTSSRGVGSMLQAYFLPEKTIDANTVNWLGYTQNIWIDPKDDLREDSAPIDAKLTLDHDKVMKLYLDTTVNLAGETKVAMFTTDAEGNGPTLSTCGPYTVTAFADISPIWEGGKKLAEMSSDVRKIFTAIPTSVAGGDSGAGMNNNKIPTPGIPLVESSLNTYPTLSIALNPDPDYSAANILKYTRGEALEDPTVNLNAAKFRSRLLQLASAPSPTVVWKLGDIINATPKVVGNLPQNTYFIDYGDSTYYQFISDDGANGVRRRTSAALIGANDGMLHAFRVGYLWDKNLSAGVKALFTNSYYDTGTGNLGKEMWAYVPYSVLPYLKYYASPDYGTCHLYYVDLSVKVYDASIGGASNPLPGDTKNKDSWHTILLGGMRFGGACNSSVASTPAGPPIGTAGFSSYFALDITDTENPIPLWEFTDADLGYTVSAPAIIRTGDTGVNGNWYVVFGSGPTQLPTQSRDIARHAKRGYLYVLNFKTGALVQKIPLANNDTENDMVGDVLVIDADKNYRSEKLYFGTTYCTNYATIGTDNEQRCTNGWKGKIMTVAIPDQDLSTWTPVVTTLFNGNYPFTASPDVAKDGFGNIWVYAGSGKYYSGVDQSDLSQQVFMGFIDKGATAVPVTLKTPGGGCLASPPLAPQLNDVTDCIMTGVVPTQGGTVQVCLFNPDLNTFATTTIVTKITNASTVPQSPIGWSIYLRTGEKAISRPLAVGGVVDYLTYVPSTDVCSHGGDSFLSAVDYTTGVPSSNVSIRAYKNVTSDEAGTSHATSGTVFVQRSSKLGPGAPPTGEAIIITPPKEGQDKLKKKIQVSTGVIVETENKPTISTVSKIINWLKK